MKKKSMVALGVALGSMTFALAGPGAGAAHAQGNSAKAGDKIANSYICVFNKNDVTRGNARAEAARLNRANGGQLKRVYTNTIRGFSTNMSATAVERLQRVSPNIAFCEQDQVVTTQQRGKKPKGGGDSGPAQETPWGITRVNGGGAGNFATAWIIDSGIDLDHPDLNVDTSRSFNAVGRNADDQNGHGTHVAGTVAAIDNAFGVIGVAPGAPVVAVRVLDRRGSGSTSGVIAGVDYVGANGSAGDVANMSLGGGISTALDQAVQNAAANSGVRFVLAAGNESRDANLSSPARANGNGIYTISAFAQGDVFASFSNFGNPPVDYASPGVAVASTWKSGGYNTISGTSMAAPHFAGILLQSGSANDGTVTGDRDNNPDVIRVVQ